jgi:hypothetical protein
MQSSICEKLGSAVPKAMVEVICDAAKKGLADCYRADSMPHTVRPHGADSFVPEGTSPRYAAISQIGIAGWTREHPGEKSLLPDLWPRICAGSDRLNSVGDIALALWAGVEGRDDGCDRFARNLAAHWPVQRDGCNAVELGWVVKACTEATRHRAALEPLVRGVLDDAHSRLLALFNRSCRLFIRHDRRSPVELVSRRIACFADQVYPILALADFGTLFEHSYSIEAAAKAADQICRFQGGSGQWQWHYDAMYGAVCEEYPVFSVHQDAMAPMALKAVEKACGADHGKQIELGLRWLFAENELEEAMVLKDEGIIWRDIERREPWMFSRRARSLCCVLGLQQAGSLAGSFFKALVVNRECRPYHLGWILYAWASNK